MVGGKKLRYPHISLPYRQIHLGRRRSKFAVIYQSSSEEHYKAAALREVYLLFKMKMCVQAIGRDMAES